MRNYCDFAAYGEWAEIYRNLIQANQQSIGSLESLRKASNRIG